MTLLFLRRIWIYVKNILGLANLDYQATDSLQQDDPHYLENPENSTYTLQPNQSCFNDPKFDLDSWLKDILNTTDVTQPIGNVQQLNQNFIDTTDVTQPIGNVQHFNQYFINEVGIDQGQAVEGLSTVHSVWSNNSPNAAAKPNTCQPKEKTKNAKRLEKCRFKK